MKVILASLNAKYIHSALSIRYLKAFCDKIAEIHIRDYSINEELQRIVANIYSLQPEIVGFSCYIWNMEQTLKVAEDLKVVLPKIKIVLGGPEVAYEAQKYLEKYNFIDVIISGEGEETFAEYLQAMNNNTPLASIKSLSYRDERIVVNELRPPIKCLQDIPFPYTAEDFSALKNKIVYYESSRGCAYSCSYCLSSTLKGVRFLSKERIEQDIKAFLNAKVKQVKFVDRTFNVSKQHALEVWKIILANLNSTTNFHFEIAADLLDDDMLAVLAQFPPGSIQFEIGVQSTNPKTLQAINRKSDISKLSSNVHKLKELGNIHLHLDLIAGLPFDNMQSFEKSFNEVYALAPHHLQLGFLKVLSGTQMQRQAQEFGIIARTYQPFEVIQTLGFSYPELLQLKEIEEVVESYHNSGHYLYFLKYVFSRWKEGAFKFYKLFAEYLHSKSAQKLSYEIKTQYLLEFASEQWSHEKAIQQEIMVIDVLSKQKYFNLPDWLNFDTEKVKEFNSHIVKNESFLARYLPGYDIKDWRNILKNYLFINLSADAAHIITGKYASNCVKIDYTTWDKITERVHVTMD